jgi:hypothetical protein
MAEHRCRTPPNSGLFWYLQFVELVDDWPAYNFIESLEYEAESTIIGQHRFQSDELCHPTLCSITAFEHTWNQIHAINSTMMLVFQVKSDDGGWWWLRRFREIMTSLFTYLHQAMDNTSQNDHMLQIVISS